ncbi:MAG: 30S ribosomal protein S6 [Peptococcia bacterium]|jgi:small subunit ribosomal protein S6
MRNYEMVYIIKPDLEEEQVNEVVEKFSALISKDGGEVVTVDNWGKRRLAYEIKDFREGNYFLVTFKGSPATARELDRVLKITDEILRFMILRKDD